MQEDNEITEAALAAEARRVGEEDEKGENKGALSTRVSLIVCAVRCTCLLSLFFFHQGDELNPVRRAQQAQDELNKIVVETVRLLCAQTHADTDTDRHRRRHKYRQPHRLSPTSPHT